MDEFVSFIQELKDTPPAEGGKATAGGELPTGEPAVALHARCLYRRYSLIGLHSPAIDSALLKLPT